MEAESAGKGKNVGLEDSCATTSSSFDADQTIGLKDPKCPAHGRPGDAVRIEEQPLARQHVAGLDLARGDEGPDLFSDLLAGGSS
jgi:hypothetical protein